MVQSFISNLTNLPSNSASVTFQTDCIRTNSCSGCNSWLCHNQGSANYDIVKGGYYEMDFNATITSAVAGAVAFALFNNGEMIPGTLMVENISTAGNYANIGINKILKVCCGGNANISVRAIPTVPNVVTPTTPIATQTPIIANANFSIKKLA